MSISTLAVVGVGLLGGSVALAARRRGVVRRVIGVDRDDAVLHRACAGGILDEASPEVAAAAAVADLVVVCVPVDVIASQVLLAASACRPGTLLTDVGSTKQAIVEAIRHRLPPGAAFVGSHPLAGSEKNGADHADADLFEDRLVVLTPMPEVEASAVGQVSDFWQALGARVQVLGPEEHDRAVALTSHLPHLLAAALAGTLPTELDELTATGFRDVTRVAAGSPRLWGPILQANRQAVLDALARLEAQLEHFRRALAEDDRAALERMLEAGKRGRDRLA
jgi:prephenate dehydrogenase